MDTQKRALLYIVLGVIVIAGGAIGFILATKDSSTANTNNTNTVVANNLNNSNLNENSNTVEVANIVNEENANANANTNTAPSETIAITWAEPTKIDSLHVCISGDPNGYDREGQATYYTNGTIAEGEYKGDQLILVTSYPEGPAFQPDMHRFIKHGESLILIQTSSSSQYEGDGLDTTKFTINTEIALDGLSYPNKITGNEARQSFTLNEWTHPLFDSNKVTKVFTHPTYGDVYTTKGYPNPSRDDDFSTHGFFIKRPDGFTQVYSLDIDFMSDAQVPDITWSNGSKNETMYSYTKTTGCGSANFADVVDPDVISKDADLKQVGTNSFGDPIYELKNSNHDMLKDLYNNEYSPYDETKVAYDVFVTQHPMFFWYDPFDRLIRFKSNAFLPQAECAKPVIYLYPEETTHVSVRVNPIGGLTYSDPAYNNGWNVAAKPNGELTEISSGLAYPYLFWEGKGGIYAQPKQGWSIAKNDVHKFLNEKLSAFGLNEKEIGDFEEFWKPRMQNASYYFITFLGTNAMNQIAPLKVSPAPNTVIRVLMDYSPLDAPIDVKGFSISTPERKGFTLVEWGGVTR